MAEEATILTCPLCGHDHDELPERTTFGDLGSKLAAQILLSDRSRRILVPSREEWVGLGLLERDDELKRVTN